MTAPSDLHGLIEQLRAMANYESRGIDMADELLHMAAALERLSARTDTGGEMVRHWRHKKRGTVYAEVGRASLQMGSDLVDGSDMVVYRGDDGKLWVREEAEFEDGRFEEVAAAPATADTGDGWDHRYRPLATGEIVLASDECRRDDGTWVANVCVGDPAPDPAYTAHRVYRRLKSADTADVGEVVHPRPFAEWHEDIGDVLWWRLPIQESPYVGSPLDFGRTMKVSVQIGFEEHDLSFTNTGGWPFDESDEASLVWTPLPSAERISAALRPAPQQGER